MDGRTETDRWTAGINLRIINIDTGWRGVIIFKLLPLLLKGITTDTGCTGDWDRSRDNLETAEMSLFPLPGIEP